MRNRPVTIVAAGYRRGATIAMVVILWSWHVVNDLPNVFAAAPHFANPAVDYGAWAEMTAVGLVAMWWLWRPGRAATGALAPWTLAAVVLATEAVFCWQCPVDLRFKSANWLWGAVGWFAIALFWHRRGLVDLLVFLGLHTALSSTLTLQDHAVDGAALGQYLMILYGTSSLQLAFAVGYWATESAARWAADASAVTAGVTTRRIAALAVHQARQERYQSIRDSARATLGGLVAGILDPAEPATRQRCAVEAARLRRLLAENDDVPEPLVHELCACADVAERRGVEVELITVGRVPDLPPSTRRFLAEAPIAVLASTRSRARITVAACPDDVAVSVVADSDEPVGEVPAGEGSAGEEPACGGGDADADAESVGDGGERVTVTYHREGPLLWTETRWRGPSVSPSSTTIPS